MITGDLNINPENFVVCYQKISELYQDLCRFKMTPELGQALCRLTEAGMWFRMHFDMEMPENLELKIKQKIAPKN